MSKSFHIVKHKLAIEREIIFGKRRNLKYYQVSKINTPAPTVDESWYVMTNLSIDISPNVAQLYSLRNTD